MRFSFEYISLPESLEDGLNKPGVSQLLFYILYHLLLPSLLVFTVQLKLPSNSIFPSMSTDLESGAY